MLSSSNTDVFLSLIRLGIGHYAEARTSSIDWTEMESRASQQGVSAVMVDGIEQLSNERRPSKEMLLQWIGETLQGYEFRYELYKRAIAELASFYNQRGFKMMVLKGYACAVNWPKPEHRPCGDIDIWLFGQQREADAVLAKEMKIKVDKSHHHHTIFYWHDFMVENHYDFDNIYARKSNREIEPLFKELGRDGSIFLELYGEKVYIPSPNLHALFLIRHLASHFVGSEINLRQVLDWAFFVEKNTKEIDWKWLVELLEKYHMLDFYNCINAICVEDLGFPVELFNTVQFVPSMKDKVLNDILNPAFVTEEPKGLIKRMVFKYNRWKGNAWKQELCYNESRWSAFWTGIWAKLLKPASI